MSEEKYARPSLHTAFFGYQKVEADNYMSMLESELEIMNVKLQKALSQADEVQPEINRLKMIQERMDNDNLNLHEKNGELLERISELEIELANSKRDLERVLFEEQPKVSEKDVAHSEELEKNVEELSQKNLELSSRNEDLMKELEDVKQQLKESEQKHQKVNDEATESKAKLEAFLANENAAKSKIDYAESKNVILTQMLNKVQDENEQLVQQNEQLKQKFEKLQQDNDKLQQMNTILNEQNQELQSKINPDTDPEQIKEAILSAQRMGSIVIDEAMEKADSIIQKAEADYRQKEGESQQLIVDADKKARQLVAAAEKKCVELQENYDRILWDASAFKAEMIDMYRRHLELLYTLPDPKQNEEDAKNLSVEQSLVSGIEQFASDNVDETTEAEICVEEATEVSEVEDMTEVAQSDELLKKAVQTESVSEFVEEISENSQDEVKEADIDGKVTDEVELTVTES